MLNTKDDILIRAKEAKEKAEEEKKADEVNAEAVRIAEEEAKKKVEEDAET